MNRFIKDPECQQMTGLSKSTRLREEKAGRFPKRYRISKGVLAYDQAEVQAWMDNFMSEVTHV